MIKESFIEVAKNNPLPEIETIFKKGSSRDSWEKWNLIIDREVEQKKKKF